MTTNDELRAGPLTGVRVVELAQWVAAPSCGALLADWGADVVKVEPPNGDPMRGLVKFGVDGSDPVFELDNRGKRSITLDVASERGRALFEELLATADVFLSNLRPVALDGFGLSPDTLCERFPRLVVATLTGFGEAGADRDRASYDTGGFWARSGMAAMHTLAGSEPPILRGAAGDHMSAAALAAGVSAALFDRERTGRGRHVSTSLLRNGIWALSQDANITLRAGVELPVAGRAGASNPIYNSYLTADGRWLWLLGLVPDPQWPRITAALGRDDWAADERYSTMAGRAEHREELKALLDAEFATRTLDEWRPILEAADVWWEPVATLAEALADPQVEATGTFIEIEGPDGSMQRTIAGPITFAGAPTSVGRFPELGEHTEELLLAMGYDWPDIIELRESGALG